jgi:hypothetical protein
MSSDGLPRRRVRNPEDANWPPSIKILRAATGTYLSMHHTSLN